MKKLLALLSLCFMLTTAMSAQDVQDYLGITDLKFDGTKYHLGYTCKNSNTILQEYFPKGQTYEKFDRMFTVYVNIAPDMNPEMAVKAKEAELAQRKKTKKDVFNWAIWKGPDGSEWIIDFLCYESKDSLVDMVEFDVHKYSMIEVGGHPALQLLFYTHRAYGDDVTPFLKDILPDFRKKVISALTKFNVKCKVKQ